MNDFIPREIIEELKEYQELVLKWNNTINLVSNNSIKDFWSRHIIDSLQLLQYIDNKDIYLIDMGSGAGFPGMILSIAGIKSVILIESDIRKCAFLKKVANRNVQVINQRVEKVKAACEVLTCRAFASLNMIFNYTENILVKEKFLLLKGKNYHIELEEARKNWSFDYSVHKSMTSEEGKILEIRNLVKIT
ncbi:16S rRNA (guanine(527)-N(7))-methyltransferase RsmG [Rickettsia endosymbiont of Halotydeus destructor]|uniref:16S rRNA (guanine(527)-N(7))-methyltransferase RsmG n=1 Tax=Rickettsia endosymbiont of Halotydeus destructor TaxID=2996754 RepID=UPI003BB162A1